MGLGCGALVALSAPTVGAAPPRGYDGPGDVASEQGQEPVPASPRIGHADDPADEGGSDDPGEPGPPATDAAATGVPGKAPPDVERAGSEPASTTWMPRNRFVYRNLIAGRANPIGFVDEITIGWRRQLVARDTELFRDSFLLVGAHGFFTPAFARVGPTIEVQPAAVLNLAVNYDFVGYFGSFGQVQSFRSPTARAGPDDLFDQGLAGAGYSTWGHLVTLSGLFQFKVGRVAFRNGIRGFWTKMRLSDGDTVFFEFGNDILHANGGWVLTNDTDLVWLFDAPVRLVVRHSLTHAFYTQDDFLPGEPVSQPNGPTLRVGPGVLWTLFDYPGARFNRPSIGVLAQWWVRHRWRTGDQIHPALPYAVIAFQFEGDIWPSRKRPRTDPGVRRKRRAR
jgi:hypothetical protein